MAIEVDLKSLRRFSYLEGGHLRFLLEGEVGALEPELADLEEMSRGVGRQLIAQGQDPVVVQEWIRTAHGWSAVMLHAYTVDGGLAWLELFAALWGEAVDGRLVGGPSGRRPTGGVRLPQLTAFAAYTTADLTLMPRVKRWQWHVDRQFTRFLMDQAITWAYRRGGRQHLCRGDVDWWMEPTDLEYASALVQAKETYMFCHLRTIVPRPFRARTTTFSGQGIGMYQVTDPTLGWRARLDELSRTLTWSPPRTDLAFVTHEGDGFTSWATAAEAWPYIGEPEVRYNRPLLASMVPDVHGMQLLTEAHLERMSDFADWKVRRLAGGRYLVTATDLEPWYAAPRPDPDVVERARQQFGEMIMTEERIVTHSPWRDYPQ